MRTKLRQPEAVVKKYSSRTQAQLNPAESVEIHARVLAAIAACEYIAAARPGMVSARSRRLVANQLEADLEEAASLLSKTAAGGKP